MQAYMKSSMPYWGIPMPVQREVIKKLFHALNFESQKQWESLVWDIWKNARYREERYAAISLCSHKSARKFQNIKAMKLYEKMIVDGAWWDYVDSLNGRVDEIHRAFPREVKNLMLQWSRSPSIWKRRVSIICQLKLGKEIDLNLLYRCIENNLGTKEFFINKAIGWALRSHAWADPKEVRSYVKKNKDRLHPLSIREALKNI